MSEERSANAGAAGKQAAGELAASHVESGMVVGLGTGSTSAWMIRALGRRVREENLDIVGVPTSFSASLLAAENGVPVRTLAQVKSIDIAFDGADEIDPNLNLIKGGGAAHTLEKIIDDYADLFVVIADSSKLVDALGTGFAVPLEVLAVGWPAVERDLRALGAEPALRFGKGKDGPVISDHGNWIADARFGPIEDPLELGADLDAVPGVIEHGIFPQMAVLALIGREDGTVDRIEAAHPEED